MHAQVAELQSFLLGLDQVVNSIQLWHDPTKHSGGHGNFEMRLREANKLIVSSCFCILVPKLIFLGRKSEQTSRLYCQECREWTLQLALR